MIGNGLNRKSIAYVENLAAFLEYSIKLRPGAHIYNYVDKPNFTMRELVHIVKIMTGQKRKVNFNLPFFCAIIIGKFFDILSLITNKKFAVSSIRIKKFCSNSVYDSKIKDTGFIPPISLKSALKKTVIHEFIKPCESNFIFHSE